MCGLGSGRCGGSSFDAWSATGEAGGDAWQPRGWHARALVRRFAEWPQRSFPWRYRMQGRLRAAMPCGEPSVGGGKEGHDV
mmetsp:Transcript_109218/g.273587  ORF Transcript_109218/g.273587 Transcript_109218/m.273587 type:complete len:81 (-) Transcript_109218:23-265(-)